MTQLSMMIGMGAFFAAMIGSRVITERAYRRLTDEQKLRLMDSFSRQRMLQMVPVALLVVLYLLVSRIGGATFWVGTGLFWLGLMAYAAVMLVLNVVKLRRLELPPFYLRSFLLGRAMVLVGVITMMLSLFLGMPR